MLYNQLITHNCKNVCTTCLHTVTAGTCAPCSCRVWSTLVVAAEVACTPSLLLLRRKLPRLTDGQVIVARAVEGRDPDR
jgi:hypothetical protein